MKTNKTIEVAVHDWYDENRATTIRAHIAGGIWITRRALREAEKRARVMPGSALRLDKDAPVEDVAVYDDLDNLVATIRK